MAYSCFEQIGLSKAYFIKQLEEASEEVKELLKKAERNTAKLRSKLKSINKQLFDVVTEALDNGGSIFFDELGITRLFVDEAHNFKNVDLDTKITGVLGISSRGSAKCQDMLHKVRMIQKLNNGGGVVMATGTPITNSITDVFVMQQYLQSGELALLDLQNFDSWVGMFAEQTTEFEIDVDTSSYRLATRFARFHNLPELTTLLSAIADFHQVDTYDDIPTTDGYCDVLIGKTEEFEEYLQEISNRAEDVRAGLVKRTEDNMLKITTDGRKAALDMRHLFPDLPFTYQCKAFRCVENVVSIRSKTMNKRSTQLIFCDSSTPKKGFNLYDEVRSWLIRLGVPETEIAYIHDATTERKRQQLFQKVQNGEVRVLIGSTFKLGLGVNVQNKLIAVHHLDVPWRPADMTQREGRILRQGNENKKVQIFRYITEGSFDAYSWQLLETKQRFIADLLAGSIETRSGSDIEDTVLNYAEVKALAVGNPKVKERVEMANHLSKLIALQRKAVENHIYLEKELTELPAKMERQKDLIAKCRRDEAFVAETGILEDKDQRRLFRKTIFDGVAGNELATQESLLMQYQGFDILLPANMSKAKPFIWLQREGRYYVELGDAEKGCLVRIDNVLLDLGERAAKLENGLEEMEQRTVALKEELTKTEDYTDQIAACKKKLKKLDQELGVDQE